jgi:hypothetical protein
MSEHRSQRDGETPGQHARRLIDEAKVALDDPDKADYHERLRAAVDRMEGELDFWAQLRAVNELVDIANERERDDLTAAVVADPADTGR